MLILKTLTRGPNHGYGIAQHIERVSQDALRIGEGSLYPALQRLLMNSWVEAEWGISETNRKARIYKITAGRPQAAHAGGPGFRLPAGRNRPRNGERMKPWTRLRYWLRRPRLEADLAEEIRLHREMLEDQLVREGTPPADARFAAERRFGNTTAVAEQSREEWSLVWIDALLRDLHFAWRLLVRQPMFAAAAILTVAFGVGANTAVVSVLETVLLNPLGLRHADRVMVVRETLPKLNMHKVETSAWSIARLAR